jgi:hypothetical protein
MKDQWDSMNGLGDKHAGARKALVRSMDRWRKDKDFLLPVAEGQAANVQAVVHFSHAST